MGDAESQLCSPETPECDALMCIMQILCQRTNQSVLLADLGALLPERHLQFIQDNGRLRKWISQYPIFELTGPRDSELISLNIVSKIMHKGEGLPFSENVQTSEKITWSEWFHEDDENHQVFVKSSSQRNTVSQEEVVMVEELLDNLLEHLLDLIDEVSNLRKQVDAQHCLSR